jgi:hypothetical protein
MESRNLTEIKAEQRKKQPPEHPPFIALIEGYRFLPGSGAGFL